MRTLKRTMQISRLPLLIMLVVVTLLAGVVVWHQWQSTHQDAKAAVTFITYQDTAGLFTLQHPSTWSLEYNTPGGESALPDWTKESRPFTLHAYDAPQNSTGANVQVLDETMARSMLAQSQSDTFHAVQMTHIGTYEAYRDYLNFTGPSAAEKYTDENYLIFHGSRALFLTFRAKYYHNYPPENWDDTKDLTAFEQIAQSIRFLQ